MIDSESDLSKDQAAFEVAGSVYFGGIVIRQKREFWSYAGWELRPEGAKQISPGQSAAALAASDALGLGLNEISKP